MQTIFPLKLCIVILLALILTASSLAQETVIHAFMQNDGFDSYGGLIFDPQGNLYGLASTGGSQNAGTVFELTPSSGGWTLTVLYDFTGKSDGGNPRGVLTMDGAGNLYGTTQHGGNSHNCNGGGCGVVFELLNTPQGWKEKVLHTFTDGSDGASPTGPVIRDAIGNLYGVTPFGGSTQCVPNGCGVVYELQPIMLSLNGPWREVTLYEFSNYNVAVTPNTSVTFDSNGNLFGTAGGGPYGQGVIYELTHGAGGWSENTIYDFSTPGYPGGGLTFDKVGNLYGTVDGGGDYGSGGVFELIDSQGTWNLSMLHSFGSGSDGISPNGLVFDATGNLYGTTYAGGTASNGTAYELSPGNDGTWTETILYNFTSGNDGGGPDAPMVLDTAGNLYSSANLGGQYHLGGIFEIQH